LTSRLIALLPLLVFYAAGAAQAPQPPIEAARVEITGIEIADFGVYTLDPQDASQTSLDGLHQRDVANVHLAEQTRIVHLKKGVHFGFHYSVVGSPPDALAPLRMVTLFPPGGLHNPAQPQSIPHSEFTVIERIGAAHSLYHGVALDYDWALVPGNWTLEIWSGDRLLASEVFTLVH
jgi:hypothetical protein